MRTPRDQGLFFTVFFSVALAVILATWLLLPAHIKHEGDEGGEQPQPKKVLKREEAIKQAEAELTKADEILSRLEKEKVKEKGKEKEKGKKGKSPKESETKTSTTKK